jgi:hypothetical protein
MKMVQGKLKARFINNIIHDVGTIDDIGYSSYLAKVFLRMRGGFSVTTEADQHGYVLSIKGNLDSCSL